MHLLFFDRCLWKRVVLVVYIASRHPYTNLKGCFFIANNAIESVESVKSDSVAKWSKAVRHMRCRRAAHELQMCVAIVW